jgi:hypothetical protein
MSDRIRPLLGHQLVEMQIARELNTSQGPVHALPPFD